MTNIEHLLATLGCKKNESAVYATLLKKGPLSISAISRALKMHRPLIYKALDTLTKKELCTVASEKGRKVYEVTDPKNIQRIVQKNAAHLESAIEDIADAYFNNKRSPTIKLLRGAAGITETFDDTITSCGVGETFYRYTSEKDLDKVNGYLSKDYRKNRDAKKLERMVISNFVSGSKKKSRLERFIKFIPKEFDQFEHNIIELVYADKIALVDIHNEMSIIIKNKPLADFQKTIFRLLYKKLN